MGEILEQMYVVSPVYLAPEPLSVIINIGCGPPREILGGQFFWLLVARRKSHVESIRSHSKPVISLLIR